MFEIFKNKRVLVCGAGGFIGSNLIEKLKENGARVRAIDLHYPDYCKTSADEFFLGDLRDIATCNLVLDGTIDYVFQLAALFGGAVFTFSGEQDADILHNNSIINLNIAKLCVTEKIKRILFTSSACVYPLYNQQDPNNPKCSEDSVYPAACDSDYGFEKLMSERVYSAFQRNYGLDIRIARLHNAAGKFAQFDQLRAKAPAAICRKVLQCEDGGEIEIIGDGLQTRSFVDIDECIEGLLRLFESNISDPINIGSSEMIAINDLAKMIIKISGKNIKIKNIEGPTGVRGRTSDNTLVREKMGWQPSQPLRIGMEKLYKWVEQQVKAEEK